jgi:hypothetical protein
MTDQNLPSLVHQHYGQVGNPQFDTNKNEWKFSKLPNSYFNVRLLGPLIQLSDGQEFHENERLSIGAQRRSLKYLSKTHPSLGLAEHAINIEAESIASSVLNRLDGDPLVGNLLSHVPERNILAWPGSTANKAVRLGYLMQTQHAISTTDKSGTLQLNTISSEKGWRGLAAPVLQISLSPKPLAWTNSQLLALRYSNCTVLLSVSLDDNRNSSTKWQRGTNVKHLHDFSLGKDPNDSLVDFCFNPLFGNRFAAITRAGKWGISDLKPKTVGCICQLRTGGDIKETLINSGTESESLQTDDGWKRILWVIDQSFILISTRTRLCIQHVTSRIFQEVFLGTPDEKYSWILDVGTFQWPRYTNLVFILTNTKLFLIYLDKDEGSAAFHQPGIKPKVEIKLSIAHGRDPLDLTSKVKLIDDGKGVYVLLSHRNSLIHIRYHCRAYQQT